MKYKTNKRLPSLFAKSKRLNEQILKEIFLAMKRKRISSLFTKLKKLKLKLQRNKTNKKVKNLKMKMKTNKWLLNLIIMSKKLKLKEQRNSGNRKVKNLTKAIAKLKMTRFRLRKQRRRHRSARIQTPMALSFTNPKRIRSHAVVVLLKNRQPPRKRMG